MKKNLFLFSMLFIISFGYAQKKYEVQSPDGKLQINILVGEQIQFSLTQDKDLLIDNSPVSMSLSTGEVWGQNAKVKKTSTK